MQLLIFNEEFLVSACHQRALITSLPFVHTARRSYRLNDPVRPPDWGNAAGSPAAMPREAVQTLSFRGRRSRNKVSVGEPAEGSLPVSYPSSVRTRSAVSAAASARREARLVRLACECEADGGRGPLALSARPGLPWLDARARRAAGRRGARTASRRGVGVCRGRRRRPVPLAALPDARSGEGVRSFAVACDGGASFLPSGRCGTTRGDGPARRRRLSRAARACPALQRRACERCSWGGAAARGSGSHLQKTQSLSMDILASATMKNAAKCDT